MSIRPIDMLSAVPRSYEVNRTNSIDAARPEMQQQHFAKQLDKEIRHDEQFVKESNKSEKGVINKDGSNKNAGSGKRNNAGDGEKGKNNEASKALQAYKSTSMLDIKV